MAGDQGFGASVSGRAEHAQSSVFRGRTHQVWAGDITYVWTTEGWLYLAVVLDLYSRRVIAWGMGSRLTQELATAALTMAVEHRRPAHGVVHHTDRGSQYAATTSRALLAEHDLTASMSRRGNC